MKRQNPRPARAQVAFALALFLVLAACGGDAETPEAVAAGEEYVVERSSADGVETVRTVSGSRWGGDGRLIEELAIGEETGDDAYLFGSLASAWATADRIYVVDGQAPAVRAFDRQGNYLFEVGATGQGPGEYSRPMAMAVADDGRVYVTDLMGARLNVYDAEGQSLEDWPLGSPQSAMGLLLTLDGEIYTRVIELPENMPTGGSFELREGMQSVGPAGLAGDPIFPPPIDFEEPRTEISGNGNRMALAIRPYGPRYDWTLSPGGELVAGVGNEYRFEIIAPDGRKTIVEKHWEPVGVLAGEVAFRADQASSSVRRMDPEYTLSESEVPATKPAYTEFLADRSGRLWVVRQGTSQEDPSCMVGNTGSGVGIMLSVGGGANIMRMEGSPGPSGGESAYDGPCWADAFIFDVFEISSGEFLGSVRAPELGFRQPLFVDGDTVLASVTDELGTVRLKQYRLVFD